MGLFDDSVQYLCNPRRVTHLFLITDEILKDCHLLDFLKTALTDGLVGRLRRHKEQRRMIPVGRHHRSDKVGDPRTVLRDSHTHLPRGPRVTIGTHSRVTFMCAVPEFNSRSREQI